jgi:hypothetical protein
MTPRMENFVTRWLGDLKTDERGEAGRLLWNRDFDRLARLAQACFRDIATRRDCRLRTVERKLGVIIRKRWIAEGLP